MPGLYTITTRTLGELITPAKYNADHQQHIDGQTPQMTDDHSTNTAQMQTVSDPGELASESLPTSLAGEIERIRFMLKEAIGGAQWYSSPTVSLGTLATVPASITTINATLATLVVAGGKAGGQTVNGGTAASETLTLGSTAHATKGKIILGAAGSAAFDEVNTRLGIGTATPTQPLHLLSAEAGTAAAGALFVASSQGTPRQMALALGGANNGFVGAISNHTFDIFVNNLPVIRSIAANLVGITGTTTTNPTPAARLHLFDDPAILLEESASTPTGIAGLTADSQVGIYAKGDKITIAFNDGGTLRYRTMTLSGTGSSWTHSTSAP